MKPRIIAVASAVCIASGCFLFPENTALVTEQSAYAKTVAEIDAEKKQKQDEITAKKAELDELAKDIQENEKYQAALQEQINLISDKMLLIDSQLNALYGDIETKETEITDLEEQIAQQEIDIEQGKEDFKKRVRSLYVHGNDSILSALIGATDFYDVLANIDILNRVAEHDDKMIDDLKADLTSLSESKDDLLEKKQALDIKVTETEALRAEFESSRTELDATMAKTDAEMNQLEQEQTMSKEELEAYNKEMDELEAEHDRIVEEEMRKEQERLRKLEEERKAKEEAEKKAREEAEKKAAAEKKAKEEAAKKAAAEKKAKEDAAKKAAAEKTTTAKKDSSTTTKTTTKATTKTTTSGSSSSSTTAKYSGGKLAWPAPGYYHISSPFGPRWGRNHNGIDISGGGIHGANACAAAAGTVVTARGGCGHDSGSFCNCNQGYGNYVVINHGNGLYTIYAHLCSINVSVGQSVSRGSVVGHIGSTGNSTGPHLHFSVGVGGWSSKNLVNPMNYLK